MTINNWDAFKASYWDWGCLDGCFGNTGIRITDIDGLVERHGQFMFIETKLPGVDIPTGQRRLIKELVKSGRFIVLVIWGHPGQPEKIWIVKKDSVMEYNHKDNVNMALLQKIVTSWFKWADSR